MSLVWFGKILSGPDPSEWQCIALPAPLATLVLQNAWEELILHASWGALFPNFPSSQWWLANRNLGEHQPDEPIVDDLSASSLHTCSAQIRSWFAQLCKLPAFSAMLHDDNDDMVAHDIRMIRDDMAQVVTKLDHWAACLEGDLPASRHVVVAGDVANAQLGAAGAVSKPTSPQTLHHQSPQEHSKT